MSTIGVGGRNNVQMTGLAPATAVGAIDAVTVLLEGLGGGLDDDVAVLALSVPRGRPTPESDAARSAAGARE